MIKVRDENGNVIPGLLKNDLGAIVVEQTSDYQRYLTEKKQQETINNLSKELSELKDLISSLLSTATINKNSTKGQ